MRTGLDRHNLARVAIGSTGVVATLQAVTAALALRSGRRDYADGVWGPGLAAVALTGAVVGKGDPWRRWTLAAGTVAWATRLETLMLGRLRGSDEEDSRYTEFLEGDSTPVVLAKVFLTQALAQVLVSAPLQVSAASRLPGSRRRWLLPAGLGVMAAGAVLEAVADRQKAAYMALDDDDKPDVLDTGVWGWSRHPNYLGDSIFWDGVWIAAAASPAGLVTLPAPIAMSYLLIYATGAKRTEEHMEERPAYQDYQRRVAFFLPRPPRAG